MNFPQKGEKRKTKTTKSDHRPRLSKLGSAADEVRSSQWRGSKATGCLPPLVQAGNEAPPINPGMHVSRRFGILGALFSPSPTWNVASQRPCCIDENQNQLQATSVILVQALIR
eukprot:scaffold3974_cov231-Pinguiococcus_pyrenoidosus.AAC.1